jgi:hypothetical protein
MSLIKLLCLCFFLIFSLTSFAQIDRRLQAENLSPALKLLLQQKQSDSISVVLTFKKLPPELESIGRVVYQHSSSGAIILRTNIATVQQLLNDDVILFADRLRTPKEELTTGAYDLSANRINLAHHQYPQYTGGEINASVKEQKLDTTDIDFKGRYFNSGVSAATISSHASFMATILGGGANSSPFAKGVAWGAQITSSSFTILLPDPDEVYNRFPISVQNHSYGTDIENFYGNDAAAYDMSVAKNKFLVHVFSAGNRGTATSTVGAYSGIAGFANLTGSFKMAKNIIAVGHIDSIYNILPPSSKGPAFDGRVKPELVAFGEDGSSGAAAMVSGTAALLQDAYKQMKGSLPSASLIKAVLLNSAEDVGIREIDYASGYGSLNAAAALKTMVNENFIEDGVSSSNTKTFAFTIPAATAQFKLTLVWTDTAAMPNAPKSLVNDLDAVLKLDATAQAWQPWVLSPIAHKDSLSMPATRKIDTLNNVEQISIVDPLPGNYTLEVKAGLMLSATQAFSIAYHIDTINSFFWTFPTASDVLNAGQTNILRWQTNSIGNGTIEYSLNGNTWNVVTTTADINKQYYKWNMPDTVTTALLRIKTPALNAHFVSDTFVISRATDLEVGFNCPDSFLLFWNKTPVDEYQVFILGEKYLQPLISVTDTFKVFQKRQNPILFYSVAPKIGNRVGLRSYTINYTVQGVDCYFRSFYALLDNATALLTTLLGTLSDIKEINFQKFGSGQYRAIHTITQPASTVLNYSDNQLTNGINQYRVQIQLTNGSFIYSEAIQVYYLSGVPVIVFPNPAQSNQPLRMITREAGVYTIQIIDASGRKLHEQVLNEAYEELPAFKYAPGFYLIRVTNDKGDVTTQKLIVH